MPIAEYLLGQTRSRVLAALFLHPDKALHVRELARVTGASAGSLHRELRGLGDAGLLLRTEIGRQVHYQANAQSPVFSELAGLLRKTAGVADVLRAALLPLGDAVTLAFIYGSIASGTENAHSDVDVMVLGRAGFADVTLALSETRATLGREVNPTPVSVADFASKLADGQGFAANVARGAKIWLKGGERMTLQNLFRIGKLKEHVAMALEIRKLLAAAERNLSDTGAVAVGDERHLKQHRPELLRA